MKWDTVRVASSIRGKNGGAVRCGLAPVSGVEMGVGEGWDLVLHLLRRLGVALGLALLLALGHIAPLDQRLRWGAGLVPTGRVKGGKWRLDARDVGDGPPCAGASYRSGACSGGRPQEQRRRRGGDAPVSRGTPAAQRTPPPRLCAATCRTAGHGRGQRADPPAMPAECDQDALPRRCSAPASGCTGAERAVRRACQVHRRRAGEEGTEEVGGPHRVMILEEAWRRRRSCTAAAAHVRSAAPTARFCHCRPTPPDP